MAFGYNDPMPADKLLRLFIIQAISSFVANDYESGVHYLKEIKQTYAEKMSQLNPTLKSMAKEIIQAVDMFNPDAFGTQVGGNFRESQPTQATDGSPASQEMSQQESSQPQSQPSSVTSELQELLRRRKEQRKRR